MNRKSTRPTTTMSIEENKRKFILQKQCSKQTQRELNKKTKTKEFIRKFYFQFLFFFLAIPMRTIVGYILQHVPMFHWIFSVHCCIETNLLFFFSSLLCFHFRFFRSIRVWFQIDSMLLTLNMYSQEQSDIEWSRVNDSEDFVPHCKPTEQQPT